MAAASTAPASEPATNGEASAPAAELAQLKLGDKAENSGRENDEADEDDEDDEVGEQQQPVNGAAGTSGLTMLRSVIRG